MTRGLFWRMRAKPAEAPAPAPVDDVPPERPALFDLPRIQSRHPNWWQVFRIEVHGLERRLVLIAECRTEDAAFRLAATQASQVRITKWGAKVRPYDSFRDPLVVIEGTVSRAD